MTSLRWELHPARSNVPASLSPTPGPHRPAPRGDGPGVGAARAGGGGRAVFVPDAGARRALGCFPGTFLLLSSGEDSSGEGPAPAHARCIKAQPSRPPQPSVNPEAVRSAPP